MGIAEGVGVRICVSAMGLTTFGVGDNKVVPGRQPLRLISSCGQHLKTVT